jgi:4-aminobutyrate aminotransferase-like enzyme
MALTSSKVIYRQHFGPLVPGVHIAQYPYCLHCKVQQEKVRGMQQQQGHWGQGGGDWKLLASFSIIP